MKISKLLAPDRIVDLAATDKSGALAELCAVLAKSKNVADAGAFQKAILDREAILSTGIGLGLAVPHAKVSSVRDFAVALGRSKAGIEWDSLDGRPVTIVVMIAANDRQTTEYTKVLASLVGKVKPDDVRLRILAAKTPQEIVSILAD
ncbi:MAG: PTS sugar transporter subunit IIA [Planctomycetes bacterium]|nr:PTS sugar transporter subunit IIA [Planctomycetota bacterium]